MKCTSLILVLCLFARVTEHQLLLAFHASTCNLLLLTFFQKNFVAKSNVFSVLLLLPVKPDIVSTNVNINVRLTFHVAGNSYDYGHLKVTLTMFCKINGYVGPNCKGIDPKLCLNLYLFVKTSQMTTREHDSFTNWDEN